MTQDVRFLQWKQAQEATDGLLRTPRERASNATATTCACSGSTPTRPSTAPADVAIDRRELTEENFDDAYAALVGQYDQRAVPLQSYPPPAARWRASPARRQAGAPGPGSLYLNANEDAELNIHLPAAQGHCRQRCWPSTPSLQRARAHPETSAPTCLLGRRRAAPKVFGGAKLVGAARSPPTSCRH